MSREPLRHNYSDYTFQDPRVVCLVNSSGSLSLRQLAADLLKLADKYEERCPRK